MLVHLHLLTANNLGLCMNRIIGYLIVVFTSIYTTNVLAQSDLWQVINTVSKAGSTDLAIQYFESDEEALRNKLNKTPNELRGQTDTIELPMPDGTLARFSIVESSIMEDALAAQFPGIKTYKVHGIDDPAASGRVDMSPNGFNGMLMTSNGRVFIDPANNTSNSNRYISRLRDGQHKHSDPEQAFQCATYDLPENQNQLQNFSRNETSHRISGSLINYRLAVAATSEYVTRVGSGTLNGAMAEIVTAINRVNQIYERDLGIHFNLVGQNASIIEVAPAELNYTNDDGGLLIDEAQTKISAAIGAANYDIGHIFSTGGGGLAGLGVVCNASRKASGVTGLGNPSGDPFYIDFVAHEIGHQFGGNHTFNGSTNACSGGNRNAGTAFEPGSGTTIMGYAGICGGENIQSTSDATFHAGTIAEINTFVAGGGACGVNQAISPANSDPTVAAGSDVTIPKNTAFQLKATGSDPDSDTLSYQWDQLDAGTATNASTFNQDNGNNPLYRSYAPQVSSSRDFPILTNQLGTTTTKGEILPTIARILNFRVIARDNKSGQATDDVRVTIDNGSGPFVLTSHGTSGPASTFPGTTPQTVTWNVANTTAAPVSCASVDIDLLSFSSDKSTYDVTRLETAVSNDGSQMVTIGDKSAAIARFRVTCNNNVFYDISNADLNITGIVALATTGNNSGLSAAPEPAASSGGSPLGGGGGGGVANSLLLTFLLSLGLSGYWLRGRMSVEIYR